MTRRSWIGVHAEVTQKRQCVLASVVRGTVYAQRKPNSARESDEVIKRLIDEEHTRHPFYGSREMVVYLERCGHRVNRKRAQRLMRSMGLAAMAPGPNTSWAHPQHKVYPYLLRGVPVVRVNQVWSTDIIYIRLASGFAYLVAIMDWYSRRGVELAHQKHHGGGILRGLTGGRHAHAWQTRGVQQWSGHAVHQRSLHRRTQARGNHHEHGWAGPCVRQHLR